MSRTHEARRHADDQTGVHVIDGETTKQVSEFGARIGGHRTPLAAR
jgi:hypothetical protein